MTRGPALKALLLAVVATAALGEAAVAQTLRVRAGEHAAYTRVVIDARPGDALDWGVEGRVLRAVVPGVEGFDVGPAARARGLSRIAGFSADGAALEIALDCECGARTQRLGDGRMVIDIAEGAPRPAPVAARPDAPARNAAAAPGSLAEAVPTPRPAEPAAAADDKEQAATPTEPAAAPMEAAAAEQAGEEPPAAPQQEGSAQTAAGSGDGPSSVDAPERDEPEAAGAEPGAEAEAPPPAETAAAAQPPSLEGDAAARIEAARQALLRQLARAADEGFLQLSDRADPEQIARETAPPPDPDLPEPNLRARTALDIARERDSRLAPKEPRRPENCLPAEAFAVRDWADDAPFEAQLAPLRRAMVGEFDRPNAEAVLAYARLMIHFGFGAEARAALAAFDDGAARHPALMEMGALVDGVAPPADGVLAAGVGCAGPHGLWAAAAAAMADALDGEAAADEALIPELARTPERLRAIVAAPVVRVALDAGDVEAAERLAGVATRGVESEAFLDAMLRIQLARIDAARGRHARAEDALAEIGRRTSPAGIEAMIELVAQRLARGLPAPDGLAENMEAVAFTLGDTPLGRRLLVAAAQARAATDGLGPALEALAVLAGRAGDAEAAAGAAREFLTRHAPDPGDGVGYARAVLEHLSLIGDGPEADAARVAVARRFASVGVDNLGESLLAPALRRGDPEARMAAGDAALAAGAPERALTHLDGLVRPDAARLRALAYAALGRAPEAARAAQDAADPEFAARLAWRAGDWSAAAQAGDPDRRILASWMAGAEALPADLAAAAEENPELGALAEALTPTPAEGATTAVGAAEAALAAARARREAMGGLLTDG